MSALPLLATEKRTSWIGSKVPIATISANRKTASRGGPPKSDQVFLDQAAIAAPFRFLRHQPSRPPLAINKPGRPAPAMGPGTAAAALPWRSTLSTRTLSFPIFPSNRNTSVISARF
jgi:hypothetical protein